MRVGPVYTPPEHRGRGYAAMATAAVSRAALDSGAREVLLFTDLANPTSNALYHRLGYRPVQDHLVLSLTPEEHTADRNRSARSLPGEADGGLAGKGRESPRTRLEEAQ